ncbi:MAG TPA: acetamidase/formamidase family protein [Chthonomonadaceae bacterium]|nr:acetamidase/formamidase family protein [Chthonomonadaceae bacterium]
MATHHFTPERYYTAMGTYESVLRIADGDTVFTTTVDAGGQDASGKKVTPGGNPQTGPFYIEGAEPGDMLAVHFDRLWPNRRIGYTSTQLASNVVDPWHVFEFSREPPMAAWELDLERGTATLAKPETKLGRLTLPLRPMLGCFGVAPPGGQAISTATSATHGGNMDYKGFEQGVTVYFPVFVEGALLFVGDGHAIQGDGEIVGTGIEVSFDVQFTVKLRKGKRIHWPRAENATHIIAVGNARPLDQALQHATSEMVRWLEDDYGLDPVGTHTLLGQCVEYEVGNVFDPAYTMVCKVSKKLLEQIGANAAP